MLDIAPVFLVTINKHMKYRKAAIAALIAAVMPAHLLAKSEIFGSKPIWFPATETTDYKRVAPFAENFPPLTKTEHFSVINAGYWLGRRDGKLNQVVYLFQVNVDKLYASRVYTRVSLENPSDPSKPIIYEHYLDPEEGNTRIAHGPLNNVKLGQQYVLSLDVFSDEARTIPIEKVVQVIESPLDNTSGCVVLPPKTMVFYFPIAAKDEGITLACQK